MEPLVLTDPDQFPSDEVISSHLGRRRALWDALFAFIHAEHPDCTERWRYYNDSKSWLLNVSRKKKTVFWLSVISGTFRSRPTSRTRRPTPSGPARCPTS